jgi:hypothetical protein
MLNLKVYWRRMWGAGDGEIADSGYNRSTECDIQKMHDQKGIEQREVPESAVRS